MVGNIELKNSTVNIKAKGSEELRNVLQHGDVLRISTAFGRSYAVTRGIIMGKHFGDKRIVECAERLAAFYKKVELDQTVTNIIESYAKVD